MLARTFNRGAPVPSDTLDSAVDDNGLRTRYQDCAASDAAAHPSGLGLESSLESGTVRTVMPGRWNYSYADGDQWFDWSPNGEWFAVTFLSPAYGTGALSVNTR